MTIRWLVLVTLFSCVVPGSGTAQQFDFVKNLFSKVDGLALFISPLSHFGSDAFRPERPLEMGFELSIALRERKEESSAGAGGCIITGVGLCVTSGPTYINQLLPSVRLVRLEREASTTVRVVHFDADGRASFPACTSFTNVSADASVARATCANGIVTITGVGTGRTTVPIVSTGRASRPGSSAIEVIVRNAPKDPWSVHLNIGFDVQTGLAARNQTLDLRSSIRTVPSARVNISPPWVDYLFYGGVFVGLSDLWNARAEVPGSPGRSLELKGQAFQFGLGAGVTRWNLFADGNWRIQRFRGVTWNEAGAAVVPPPGWPRSIDISGITLRVGLGFNVHGGA